MVYNESGVQLPTDYNKYEDIYNSLSDDEKKEYGYGVGIDKHTVYTKRIENTYVILDDYTDENKNDKYHPYSGMYISIAASKCDRGKGYTDNLISSVKHKYPNYRIVAIIHSKNKHSINLFKRNDFKFKIKIGEFDYYVYERKI